MSQQQDSLLSKLDELDNRYAEIDRQVSDPAVASDVAKYIPLAKEQGKIKSIVEKYRQYKEVASGIVDAETMLADPEIEDDFRELAKEVHAEICSMCHPFYTGKQKFVDTAGRIERFQKKYGKDYFKKNK